MDGFMRISSSIMLKLLRLLSWALITQPLLLSAALPSDSAFVNRRTLHQDIVTWDQYSIKVYGERVLLLSGEFHPFRLPSPGLWLDVFQKIRALGFSATSFYLNWALLEGERGHIRTDGVFSLREFIAAAKEAGIYLIARPGPYINSEVSGGGFPGWLERIPGKLRNTDPSYLDAITPYMLSVGRILAEAQITNGGPIILFQPENEYSLCGSQTGYIQANNLSITSISAQCLNKSYMAYVESQYRKAGIVVPFIVNDAFPEGNFAPNTGVGEVDIYSFDFYPLGWSTAPSDPSDWAALIDPRYLYNYTVHQSFSPTSPFSISEFQGGTPDAWGGVGVETSAAYIGPEFERILYKLNYGYRAAIQNLYMIFGGTNWGNLGYPGGYTSYDVGAAIAEDRQVHREKYSELKLQASFLQASPEYLQMHPDNGSYGQYTDTSALAVTRLVGNPTNFYIVRHGVLASTDSTLYKLRIPTSSGELTVPQLGGHLSLHGRDSKIHVVDYDVGGTRLIYSSAEVFSWKKAAGSKSVLILYGGALERHEFAVPVDLCRTTTHIEGNGVHIQKLSSGCIVQWEVEPLRRVVSFGDKLEVHLLWRNEAYNYWVLDLPVSGHLGLHASPSRAEQSVIVKAGYLMRSATISGDVLHLTGDVNATTELEVIAAPRHISSIIFNGEYVKTTVVAGRLRGKIQYNTPNISLPSLRTLHWHYLDSLPEVKTGYDDSLWTRCNNKHTNNPRNLTTPTSLYASDYGYNGGSLLYRGTFVANGSETSLYILTEGGYAYGHSVWLDSTYITSWPGTPAAMFSNQTLKFPGRLKAGKTYVVTLLIDHLGNDENFVANQQVMKDPRGLLDYSLNGRDKDAVSWKMTGNLGGEQYRDLSRGPLNEGGLYAERQGYHLPGAPTNKWKSQSPFDGVSSPGVAFFATSFTLDLPAGYDIPISVVFTNTTSLKSSIPSNFRAQIFINGWQFGKYINNIGPQLSYPIPEGILDHNGVNYLAITLWSMDDAGVKLGGLALQANAVVQSAYKKPQLVQGQRYSPRYAY